MSQTQYDAQDIQRALDERYDDRRWLSTLTLFLPTGVADTHQLQRFTDLSRHQLKRLLDFFNQLAPNAILARLSFHLPKPGLRGRSPTVYTLGHLGAALLRANDHSNAHPCGLSDPIALSHARATLDVHLAALDAGLAVRTERSLSYGQGRSLRPDNLVTLPSSTPALFETEQEADSTLLRRIVDSLRNKAAFFQSQDRRSVSPTVRVLVNLPLGRAWDRTIQTWERAFAIVVDENQCRPPFKIVALPLSSFLNQPDWGEPPDPHRWESLFDPAQSASFAPSTTQKQRAVQPSSITHLPASLKRRSPRDDQLILLAFLQTFQEQAPALDLAHPDPAFFSLMRLIYVASHDPYADLLTQAALPHASLNLLRRYLAMHSSLRTALSKTITRGASSIKWSVPTIIARMQVVIDTFLRYHGWRSDGPLLAYPAFSDWNAPQSRTFAVVVRIRHPELLMLPDDQVVPTRTEVQQAEEALAWVLWSLFSYNHRLGLKRARFW